MDEFSLREFLSRFNCEDYLLFILEKIGAIVAHDHIVYTSGRHGSSYIKKDKIYLYPYLVDKLCAKMAEPFLQYNIDVVVGPLAGGIIFSNRVANFIEEENLGKSGDNHKEVLSIFTDKDSEGRHVLKRGYDKEITGKRVLVTEDVINSGKTVLELLDLIKSYNGKIVGVSAIVNRNPNQITGETLNVKHFSSLLSFEMDSYNGDACPLCLKGIPFNLEIGHAQEFKEKLILEGKFSRYSHMF